MKLGQPLNAAAIGALNKGDIENFFVAATPGGIEAQEARGQKSFVGKKDSLPKNCGCRSELEQLGFVFGEPIDDLFVSVTFPEGWTKQTTDHSMWSNLVDPKGRIRGNMFYKAAFYDRSAHMHSLNSRYSYHMDYDHPEGSRPYRVKDNATQETLFSSGPVMKFDREHFNEYQASEDTERAACVGFLDTNFPDYKNPLAYWD